ncbi:MAG: hypothetical protein PHY44_03900 [Lachnospiraceae bacterium]|nr:hypothetical protein [Lachnospiraceae bacterium]
MKNKSTGLLGIIFGGLFLSFEIYFLTVIKFIDKSSGSWNVNAWAYVNESPCEIALLITVAVIFFSLYIFFASNDSEK